MTRHAMIFTMAMLLIVGACGNEPTQTEEEMKALAERMLPVFNEGNLALIDELCTPDYVHHEVDIGEDLVGADAFKEWVTSVRTSYPDFNITLEELIIKGDKIVMRWTATGTHTGSRGDLPPTGKQVRFSGVTVSRVVNGKMAETWVFYNQAAVLLQLGFELVPPEEQGDD